jgi:4-hydroxymandelate oxidase
MVCAPRDLDKLISDPKEALDVFDFEPVARKNVPPAHFGYIVTGIDDEVTLRANREGFLKFQLRPRRLVDVGTIDMTIEIFGAKYDRPIVAVDHAAIFLMIAGTYTRSRHVDCTVFGR